MSKMICNDCGHEFDAWYDTKWVKVKGGGKVAVCPECESSYLSDKPVVHNK